MRIVQLITQPRGGPVDHAVDMALAFAAAGHESHLIGPPGAYVDRLRDSDAHWHGAYAAHKLDLRGGQEVTRLLTRLRPEVLHAQDRRAGLVGRLWATRRAVPSVYTLHGVPDSLAALVPGNVAVAAPRRRDRLTYLACERELARISGSVVVTPCAAVATYARRHIGILAEQVAVVPNGVAMPSPAPLAPPAPAPPGPDRAADPVAVWLGVMQPVKRLELLVRAVAAVPRLRLRLVGDGPLRFRVETLIADLGIADRVELTGFLTEPTAVLAGADLFVLPSAAEACPLALLQAMALGLPAVTTRAGGLPELVRDEVDGLLVDTDDQAGLTRALLRLGADDALRRRLGRSARDRVGLEFTLDRCADRLLSIYAKASR